VASLHCCAEYAADPTEQQVAAVRALLASPDVDLVLGHHAHVVQPMERVDEEWAAYGLGNHVAQHSTRGYATEDSMIARFTFTRGADGRFGVTRAEAIPVRIDLGADAVRVLPADTATRDRVAAVLGRRGAVAGGLEITAWRSPPGDRRRVTDAGRLPVRPEDGRPAGWRAGPPVAPPPGPPRCTAA